MALATLDTTPVVTPALPLDTIIHGDCLAVLRGMPDNSVDAIVTDPPAGISFMGKRWDSDHGGRDKWVQAFAAIYRECLRVLKPGGHALVWALPRTSHWTATALEDAGFEIRDRVSHVFGSGFPKSLDVSKALDKAAGAKRDVIGPRIRTDGKAPGKSGGIWRDDTMLPTTITAPATDAARDWDGWGTALKPSVEDWWLVRKPISERNVGANVLRWGVGALNIGGSRVAHDEACRPMLAQHDVTAHAVLSGVGRRQNTLELKPTGRWPSHLLLSHSLWCGDGGCAPDCPIRQMDAQSGVSSGRTGKRSGRKGKGLYGLGGTDFEQQQYQDTGGASRFFQQFAYIPKASRAERNRGCDALRYQMRSDLTPEQRAYVLAELAKHKAAPLPVPAGVPTPKPTRARRGSRTPSYTHPVSGQDASDEVGAHPAQGSV